jgi:hypothetical protein
MTTRSSDDTRTRKTAIAVPARLLAEVDAAARERGESRSRFIQRVLHEALRARSDAQVRRRLDALFKDEDLAAEQTEGARACEAISTRWGREAW